MKTALYLISLEAYRKHFPHYNKRQTERIAGEFALRTVLSEITGMDWDKLEFCRKQKPYLKHADIEFNVSHTEDLLAFAVGSVPLGVDIEAVKGPREKVLQKYFTEAEKQYVTANGAEAFYEIWTKKESFVKFTGEGIKGLQHLQSYPDEIVFFSETIRGNRISVCSLTGHLPEKTVWFNKLPTNEQLDTLTHILENPK